VSPCIRVYREAHARLTPVTEAAQRDHRQRSSKGGDILETYDYEHLKGLGGHEVVASDGEKVGYVDLVFCDHDSEAVEVVRVRLWRIQSS
jgi:hypothetical protein